MQGGYLGVSLFFTLSGFLITSLLLVEQQRTGSISLRRFWGRRFRRVLPAAWLTLLAVVIAGWFLLDANEVSSFRGDVRASFLQVSNWRFLFEGQSYGDLFRSPSPVLHFWSLSIEEQLYLLYPLLLVGLLAVARGRRHLAALVLGIGALLSWGLPVLLGASLDRIYYGTDTRAGELLAGALLALRRRQPPTAAGADRRSLAPHGRGRRGHRGPGRHHRDVGDDPQDRCVRVVGWAGGGVGRRRSFWC